MLLWPLELRHSGHQAKRDSLRVKVSHFVVAVVRLPLSHAVSLSSCGGDVTSFCGGAGALTVYKASMTASDPATFTSTNGTKYNLQGG
jgi:hypothetical protein